MPISAATTSSVCASLRAALIPQSTPARHAPQSPKQRRRPFFVVVNGGGGGRLLGEGNAGPCRPERRPRRRRAPRGSIRTQPPVPRRCSARDRSMTVEPRPPAAPRAARRASNSELSWDTAAHSPALEAASRAATRAVSTTPDVSSRTPESALPSPPFLVPDIVLFPSRSPSIAGLRDTV
jgi:hypothetical protein